MGEQVLWVQKLPTYEGCLKIKNPKILGCNEFFCMHLEVPDATNAH